MVEVPVRCVDVVDDEVELASGSGSDCFGSSRCVDMVDEW